MQGNAPPAGVVAEISAGPPAAATVALHPVTVLTVALPQDGTVPGVLIVHCSVVELPQALPHIPQLMLSRVRSTHLPLQQVSVALPLQAMPPPHWHVP